MAQYISQFGIEYGSWESENEACLSKGITSGSAVKVIQLCWAVVSLCQVIFMLTRAPRVAWEAIYLPLAETITYFLAFTGNGYLRMADGQIFPWARMASWLVTCPVMLGQVSAMALIKYKSLPLNNMMMAASLVRVVMGITATITPNSSLKWMFFFFGVSMLTFEYFCVFTIFSITIADFQEIDTPLGRLVTGRLKTLRIIFHSAWTCFPILWVVSSTGLCVLDENYSSVCYMLADAACKNGYGLVLWSTTWGHLNGKWDRDYARNKDKIEEMKAMEEGKEEDKDKETAKDDIKIFGKPIASLRRSSKKKRTDVSRGVETGRNNRDTRDEDDEDVSPGSSKVKGDSRDDRRREDGGSGDRRKRYEEDFARYRDDDRDDRRRNDDDYDRRDRRNGDRDDRRYDDRRYDDRRYDKRDDRDKDEHRSGFKRMENGRDEMEERMMENGRDGDRDRANPRDIILSAMQRPNDRSRDSPRDRQ